MGTSADKGREDQRVEWLGRVSPVGIDGYCEYLDVKAGAEVIGRFQSAEPVLNNQPAATRQRLGKGSAIKLAFWPKDDSVAQLFRSLLPAAGGLLGETAPRGVQAVPRSDGSLFVVNTSAEPNQVRLARPAVDRISGRKLETVTRLKPYDVLWVE
jgi:beta-galactosidase GanA